MKAVGEVVETRSLGRMAGRMEERTDRRNNGWMRVVSRVPLHLRRVTINKGFNAKL